MKDPTILTDSECAVTFHALAMMRDQVRAEQPYAARATATPNIDSALEKLRAGYGPTSQGIRFEVIQP